MRNAVALFAFFAPLLSTALGADSVALAQLERPITGYEWVDPSMADIVEPNSHTSNIIFLNRCVGGCVISPGFNDSKTNRSSIPNSTVSIQEWNQGDAAWDEMVRCVTAMYDPYDIEITDIDPGPNVDHFEAIVAGTASNIGAPANVGGIAPYSCGVINNAITFSFANAPFYENDVKAICETVAQETAHAFGLDHEYLCTDPMTYLPDCGPKWFQDINSDCGEYEPEGCDCGSPTQNSHARILGHFGPNPLGGGPQMEFVRPLPSSSVEANFFIEVSAGDYYYDLTGVEIFVNGESIGSTTSAPYIFNPPAGLDGYTTIEVRATDIRGYTNSKTIEVNVGAACTASSCPEGRVCLRGFCAPDASTPGGFAGSCEEHSDCIENICAEDDDGSKLCTATCELNKGQCPPGWGCTSAGDVNVCWEGVEEDTGCGCSSSSPASNFSGLFLVLAALVWRRRKSQEA